MQDGLFIVYMDEGTLQTESGEPVRMGEGPLELAHHDKRCSFVVAHAFAHAEQRACIQSDTVQPPVAADRPNNTYIAMQHVLLTGQPLPNLAPPASEVEERQCAVAWCVLAWACVCAQLAAWIAAVH